MPSRALEGGRAADEFYSSNAGCSILRRGGSGGAIRADLGPTHAASGASAAFTPLTLLLTLLHPTTFQAEQEEEELSSRHFGIHEDEMREAWKEWAQFVQKPSAGNSWTSQGKAAARCKIECLPPQCCS